MGVVAERKRFTIDEYHKLGNAGVLGENDRIELVEGELIQMAPIGSVHAAIVARLQRLFHAGTDQYDEFVRSMNDTLRRVRDTCYRRPHVEWLAMKAWLHLRRSEPDAARSALTEARYNPPFTTSVCPLT
jgi:Uma2 family endonuclease